MIIVTECELKLTSQLLCACHSETIVYFEREREGGRRKERVKGGKRFMLRERSVMRDCGIRTERDG